MADVRVEKRSCTSCGNIRLCKLYYAVQDALNTRGSGMLNIYHVDSKTPGIFTDIYEAIGKACLEFQPRRMEEDRETE